MKRYRKKPVVIEAEQWWQMGDSPVVHKWEADQSQQPNAIIAESKSICRHCGSAMPSHGRVKTLEGWHIVCPGDWIIRGIKGEYYPCKPDIFKQTYEPA